MGCVLGTAASIYPENTSWNFEELSRVEAESRLWHPLNENGAFLIRRSEHCRDHILSVKSGAMIKRLKKNAICCQKVHFDSPELRDGDEVKHYKIRRNGDGKFHMSSGKNFHSLDGLVNNYMNAELDHQPHLRWPCVKIREQTNLPEIDKASVKLYSRIGEGQFSEVYSGKVNDKPVAVKVAKPGRMSVDEFMYEARTMSKLTHHRLVRLYGACSLAEPVYIVMELLPKGNLLEFLRGEGSDLKVPEMITISAQIASGMAHMESHNYAHRDLAARNILVEGRTSVKVSDFGLSRFVQSNASNVGAKFATRWAAPECITEKCFTSKSDVWSFGILLMEIVTHGRAPYPGMTSEEVVDRLTSGYRMPCPTSCPAKLYKIIRQCWNSDNSERPSFELLKRTLVYYFK